MEKRRVLFLCVGNACRSQMAEAFARTYGSDIIEPCSAGLGPAAALPALTIQTMLEKNIDLAAAFPKGLETVQRGGIDLIVNLTGSRLPVGVRTPVEDWDVPDPIGASEEVYRQVRDEIEGRVMKMILTMRAEKVAEECRINGAPRFEGGCRGEGRSTFDIRRRRFRQ